MHNLSHYNFYMCRDVLCFVYVYVCMCFALYIYVIVERSTKERVWEREIADRDTKIRERVTESWVETDNKSFTEIEKPGEANVLPLRVIPVAVTDVCPFVSGDTLVGEFDQFIAISGL